MIEPAAGRNVPAVVLPKEFYWVLETPAPLAGMKYPRGDFPWANVARAGFSRLVALEPGEYDPSPLTVLCTEELEDLVHGRPPRDRDRERKLIASVVRSTTAALLSGNGVVVHCAGGRGRTGTVVGCVLRELGYGSREVLEYLDRLHQARGKPGWPEARWQGQLVGSWGAKA